METSDSDLPIYLIKRLFLAVYFNETTKLILKNQRSTLERIFYC